MIRNPQIKMTLTPTDKMLEGVVLLVLILTWVYVVSVFDTLPETIPTHFNGAGEVDKYGSRATIFALPIVASGIALIFFIVQLVPPEHLKYPRNMNYRNVLTMLRILKLGICLFTFLLCLEIVSVVKGEKHLMGPYFWVWLFILIFLPTGIFIFRSIGKRAL